MKTILLSFGVCIILTGCAGTTIYEGGIPIARIQADATNVTLKTRGTYFHADALNHSHPTTSGGAATAKVIGSVGTAATAIGAAFVTGGALRP